MRAIAVSVLYLAWQVNAAVSQQAYTWNNVRIGGGGGFVPNIVFNPSQQGLAYARTDIGGAYRLNSDDSWTPLLDFANDTTWHYWGTDALATDPVTPANLYVAVGMYTNSYDPNNGSILRSTNYGSTWSVAANLPFKVGGNMPGRGLGERLAVDPHLNSVLFFGARSGNGLWKSTNSGSTWTKVSTLPSAGTYIPDPSDTTGYESDIIGVSFVTFDSTSGSAGAATPRIFVGVASLGSNNVFVSNDGGSTWSAVAGQNNTYMPHKGVLSPAEKTLYLTYSNGAGPYDGTLGSVVKYNISSGVWTDITPVNGSNLFFGFGGLGVDIQRPGTIMVAALNCWWPDGQIFRSIDSGATWTTLWDWVSYPTLARNYKYNDSLAPWLSTTETGPTDVSGPGDTKQIGWMMEGLSIDPFDSNHWLYGTGETIYGGHDLLNWDTIHNVTLESLANGVEETSVQQVISPSTGPSLISAVGDDGGFVHLSLTTAPQQFFTNPAWATTVDLDYAGQAPTNIVRIGSGDSSSGLQVALSTDSGNTWQQDYGAAENVTGGHVAISAAGDTVLWMSSSNGPLVSRYTNPFSAVPSLPSSAVIASDKVNNAIFYAAAGSQFYISTNNGVSFNTTAGSLGSSTSPVKIAVNPSVTGDAWVSSNAGLFHTVNNGTSFTAVSGFSQAYAISLGAPAQTGGYPAVFAIGNYNSVVGVFRSDDQGMDWVQINDAAHGFGSAGANCISGDPRIYGRVYIGTNGRGIFYGDINGTAPPPTSSSSSTSTSSTTSKSSTTSSTTSPSSTTTTSTTSKSTTTSSTTTSSTTTSSTTSKSTTTTTTTPSTTSKSTSTSTSTTSAPSATATHWGQCGGIGYTGPTVCATGSTCTVQNPYYSQCL